MSPQRKGFCLLFVIMLGLSITRPVMAQAKEDSTVRNATAVLDQIMAVPAKQIPKAMLMDARAVAIVPGVVKGGFVVGVRHGKGVVLVRNDQGQWQPPSFVSLTGGSVGWQAGIQSTDVILVFKTRKSVEAMLQRGLTIGVDAAAAAGPVGRDAMAATNPKLQAEIYSYSRSRGLFLGVSLDGSAIQVDNNAAAVYYRGASNNPQYAPALPESAVQLMNRVTQYSAGQPQPAPASQPQPTPAIPGQIAAAQPGTALPPPNVPPPTPVAQPAAEKQLTPSSELVRRQLVSSWQQLSRLLDDRWDGYLALPAGTIYGNEPVTREALDATLQRYASIAANPQYQILAKRHEFTTTYHLLREYATLQFPLDKELALPPPPAGTAAAGTPGRY